MMQKLRIALGAITALLLLSFIVQNHADVPVNFWPLLHLTAPLWLIIAGSAGLGVLAFYFFRAFKNKKQP